MKLISSTSGGVEEEKFNNFRTNKRINQLPDIRQKGSERERASLEIKAIELFIKIETFKI